MSQKSDENFDQCGQSSQPPYEPLTQEDPVLQNETPNQSGQFDGGNFKSPEDEDEIMEYEDEHSAEAALSGHDLVEQIGGNF